MDKSRVQTTNVILFSFLVSAAKQKWYHLKQDIMTHSMITFLWKSELYFRCNNLVNSGTIK